MSRRPRRSTRGRFNSSTTSTPSSPSPTFGCCQRRSGTWRKRKTLRCGGGGREAKSFYASRLVFFSSCARRPPTPPPPTPQLTSPVTVNWAALDTSLLARFWRARPAERARAAAVCDRVLVYHRGVKTLTASGRFIDDKIDLLVQYLIVAPLASLAGGLRRRARRGAAAPDAALALQQAVTGSAAAPETATVTAAATAAAEAADAAALGHNAAQTVRRVALRSALPTAWSVLKALPAKHTIKEPAYKDMVVLYRRVVPDEQVGRGGGGVAAAATAAGTRKEHGLGRLTPPTVHAPRCARPKRSPSGTTTRRPRGATSTSSASSTFRRRTSKWSSPTKRSGSNHSS